MSLSQARERRKQARKLFAQDVDPKAYKDEQQIKQQEVYSNILYVVAQNWFSIKESSISPNYAKDIWRSLELHVFPSLGKYPVASLAAPVTIAVLQKVAKEGGSRNCSQACAATE